MRQTLASMVEGDGEDSLLEGICARVAEGESPMEVARSMGLTWFVVREWLEGGDGMQRLELAKRCYADGLVWEGLRVAMNARMETLPLDKFQAEYFQKSAALMNPQGWGGKEDKNGGGITVVVQRGLEAKVEGGVLTILPEQNKGYPVPDSAAIEGELVG